MRRNSLIGIVKFWKLISLFRLTERVSDVSLITMFLISCLVFALDSSSSYPPSDDFALLKSSSSMSSKSSFSSLLPPTVYSDFASVDLSSLLVKSKVALFTVIFVGLTNNRIECSSVFFS